MASWIFALLSIFLATVVSAQDGCKFPATITAQTGTIFSPYYEFFPDFTYPASSKCRWTITVASGKNIRITFSNPMSFETTAGCSWDWVAIFNNNRPEGTALCAKTDITAGPFCPGPTNPVAPGPFVLAGNSIVVEFCSDSAVHYQGFELNFAATDEPASLIPTIPGPGATTPEVPIVCGGSVTIDAANPIQFIESPNHPGPYPNNANCVWDIIGPVGDILGFDSTAFGMEGGSCTWDYVMFTDTTTGTEVDMGRFCGTSGPKKLRSVGNKVRLTFRTDGSSQNIGFRIRIQKPRCPANQGSCPNTGDDEICFQPDQLCDGINNCPGNADEFCPAGCGIPPKKPLLSTKEKIVGGIEAKPNTWPWQVVMMSGGSLLCGGSIIDHHWVVTAAHCCEAYSPVPSSYQIRVGEHSLTGNMEKNAWTYDLEKVIVHPQYGDSPATHHDICLLKTTMPIFFNDDVFPVCLGSGSDTPVGTNCYVTGWGNTDQRPKDMVNQKNPAGSARISDVLRQVDVAVEDHDICNTAYNGVITDDMICGYSLDKDSCQGDSGGPFVCPSKNDPNSWELVGIVSWGRGCASPGYPGVYARTSHFLDWISQTVMSN